MFKSRYKPLSEQVEFKIQYKIIIIGAQEETVNRSLTIFALLILQFFHQRKILPQRVPL